MPDSTQFDWSDINGTVVERLAGPKIYPVPDPIIAQAQRSADLKKAIRHTFTDRAKAEAFAAHMKHAGPHLKPKGSMTVTVKPGEGDSLVVQWKAGKPRGKAPTT